IRLTFGSWAFRGKNKVEFDQAESKRKKLIELKKIGPEFAEKYHSEAIYTSRPLSDLISKCSSTNSSSTISYDNKQVTKSLSSQNLSSKIQTCSASFDSNYISADLELDIDTESIKTQNSSKRNIEELNFEADDDNEKSYVSQLEIALNNVHIAIEEYELLILMKRKSNCEFHGYRSQTRTEAREKLNRLFPKDMEVFKIVLDKLFIALNLNLKIYDFFKRC
ncbi:16081_t:CDS:2, partial [Rhizophagus irregularis]